MSSDPRRAIPAVDALLMAPPLARLVERHGRDRVVVALRSVQARVRLQVAAGEGGGPADEEGWGLEVEGWLAADEVPSLRWVINATGVVLHTNLGRAPLAAAARAAMARAAEGYGNLEFDLDTGRRGSRYHHCASLLRELTGAEDALVVNNAAAALILALNTVARGRGVAVSRGELVEIGGGFRIPEILERAGVRLVEVGSTNRTRIGDYAGVLDGGEVGAILKVHRSNFRMSGFTEETPIAALASLAREAGIPLLHDLGSGLLVEPGRLGLPPEPRARGCLQDGAELVVVSGDKLMGGPQAGIAVGSAPLVDAMRRNPLCRALRVDKVTLAGLEATLRLSRDEERAVAEIPTLRMLALPADEVRARVEGLRGALAEEGIEGTTVAHGGAVGGGTYPDHDIPSWALALDHPRGAEALLRRLRAGETPVVARVEDDRVLLDLRTVDPEEDLELTRLVGEAWRATG